VLFSFYCELIQKQLLTMTYAMHNRVNLLGVLVATIAWLWWATCATGDTPGDSQQTVHVCQDAGAGGYEAFPDVCRRKDGQLMCVFYAGYGHVSLPNAELPRGGRICYCTSADEGKTWSASQTLFDGEHDDRDPSITQLKDGRLACTFFSLAKPDKPGIPHVGLGAFVVTSADGGQTWSPPHGIAGRDYYCSSPMRELSNGHLVLGLYHEQGGMPGGAVTTSEDGGKTWLKPVHIDGGEQKLAAETDVIELKDGRLYAALRGDGDQQMCWSASRDHGRTWTTAKPIGFLGHCPYLHRTADGIILLGHRQPATSLNYSLDEAKTWSPPVRIDSLMGAYPSMVNLQDGSVLVVYYEEGPGSSIRAKRFRATPQGIQWIGW
jgi:Neuraminidase (sialidase)